MPHRTVFQLGKNHAHPFTMFIGGFVIGALVTGAIAWAWAIADSTNRTASDTDNVITKKTAPKAATTPAASVAPSASPAATF
jgi:hypothetical protein